jgi:hypothetical protein
MRADRSLALVAAVTTFLVCAPSAGAVPRSSQIVPGERVGAVKIGMSKRKVESLLGHGRRGGVFYSYQYPKVSLFELNYAKGGVSYITTNGRRFDYRGVRLGQRVKRIKRKLKALGFTPFRCAGLNGRRGYRHGIQSDLTYDLDYRHHRKLDTLEVARAQPPICE